MSNECPYVTDEALRELKDEISKKVIADIKRDVIPDFRRALAADIKNNIYRDFYASIGKETFSLGKKIVIRFIVLLGLAALALMAWLGSK